MTIIDWCADKLMIESRAPTNITRNSLVGGLRALHTLTIIWASNEGDTRLLRDFIVEQFQTMSDLTCKNLGTLFRALSGCPGVGWTRFDEDSVASKSCKMSLLLWALKIGPHGFMDGWKNGKTAIEIMKAAEDDVELMIGELRDTRRFLEEILHELKDTCG